MSHIPTAHSTRRTEQHLFGLPLLPLLAAILAIAPSAWAATTDLSNQPLATLPSLTKPNLLFVMDSSGSMGSGFMPDDMYDSSAYGYRSAQCNGVAYDPTITYSPPVDYTNTPYPDASLTATKDDGYNASSTTTAIFSNSFYKSYFTYHGTQPKMGWTYTTAGVDDTTFSQECFSSTAYASSVFTKVTLTSSSTEAQNYANWYSYYRKRYLLMRTAMGRAIAVLDDKYRVGFSTIYDVKAQDGVTNFVDVNDFNDGQKQKFYTSLYTVMPSGGTNLPDALSEAGRYYAHKISGQTEDPVQYSCQRNFTLLSTDGYWNTNSKDFELDGTTRVGEQDATEVHPMKDAGVVGTTSTETKYSQPVKGDYVSNAQTLSVSWTRISITSVAGADKSGKGGTSKSNCTAYGYYAVQKTTQTATETLTRFSTAPETGTSKKTETVVKDATGAVISDTTTTPVTTWDPPGTATYVYTDTSTPASTDGNPVVPSYPAGTTKVTSCTKTPPSDSSTDTPVAGSWTPSSVTYNSTNVTATGPWSVDSVVVTAPTVTGGSSDTLSDVAEYYYVSHLRSTTLGNCTSSSSGSAQNLCNENLPVADADKEQWQHMNTYTIGLGTNGTLPNTPDTLASLTAGTVNWPTPNPYGDATNVDDLWHAALNGRGQYYSALSASQLSAAIADVVYRVQKVPGSGTAASTSSLELVAGDNEIYRASYTTGAWTGDLQAFMLNGADASLISSTPSWSAQDKLDAVSDPTTRTIYFSDGTTLQPFTYSALTTASKNASFDNICSKTPKPTQCSTLSATDLATANSGANLVNYLIGGKTNEGTIYRKREHVLGDIVDGAPVFVGKPPFSYADAGYADFVLAQKSRKPVVYVAANDGMLHAFSATVAAGGDGGTELWAYVPTFVIPNLYKLADTAYPSAHQYYVDGAPVMADIKVGSTWKTILVGGLNGGGKGYYALDITNPASPVLLWEFSNANLGYSFGNPVITKRADGSGTWVVVFTSGYNNADGLGHLFVVDANTGTKLVDINTGAGSPTSPSGLAKINAWIEDSTNNTSTRFYGGDLLGNLWRFDPDHLILPSPGATLLAQLQIDSTTPQPITTRPETASVGTRAVVMVGTGQFLGSGDKTVTTQQSVYGIADNLTTTGWGDVRNGSLKGAFVKQVLTISGTTASITNNSVDFTDPTVGGWIVDLPDTGDHLGERVATNMSLQFNTLAVATAIPADKACTSGGSSWRYYFNTTNGGVVKSTVPAGQLWSATSLIVGMSWVKDSNGDVRVIYQNSDGKIQTDVPPTSNLPPGKSIQSTSWRELTN